VWIEGGALTAYSSTLCTLGGIKQTLSQGKQVGVAFVFDKSFGIKLFADKAFYALNTKNPKQPEIVPFLLKKDAEAWAAKTGGRLANYTEALAVAKVGG
jgi:NitT/TauT family transport system substrate-binding protein